jgi:excisionase family DNA binding protein
MNHTAENRDYYTVADACQKLERSRWTIWRLINEGKLAAEKEGDSPNGRVLIPAASIAAYLRTTRVRRRITRTSKRAG